MKEFSKRVLGPSLNHVLACANSAQLFGHGVLPAFVEVGGVFHQIKSVEVHNNPSTGEPEVLLITSE